MIVTSVQIKTAKTQKHLYCLVFTKKGKYRKMLTFFYLSAIFCSYEIVFVIQSFTEYTLTC